MSSHLIEMICQTCQETLVKGPSVLDSGSLLGPWFGPLVLKAGRVVK